MMTFRKAVIAAAFFLTVFFLMRSSSHSTPSPLSPNSSPIKSAEDLDAKAPPPPHRSQTIHDDRASSPSQPQMSMADMAGKPLRDRLRFQFPYDIESKFPAYIWQTWKYAPSSGQFGERLRPAEASWSEKHPSFVHEVITDDTAVHMIRYLFASVPEVVEAYKAMPVPVLKADFFRYLILLARGGIYSDIDTFALKPAIDWLPEDLDRSTIGLVIGIEADPDRPDWNDWYARRIQFCQWTIQSKPGHPVLRDIVATITEDTLRMRDAGILSEADMDKSIMEFTGPGVWTDAVFNYLNNPNYFDIRPGTNISWVDFAALTEHKKVGDTIVLPITSFSPGVGQMGAKDPNHPMAFVKHEFEGVWKPASERKQRGRTGRTSSRGSNSKKKSGSTKKADTP